MNRSLLSTNLSDKQSNYRAGQDNEKDESDKRSKWTRNCDKLSGSGESGKKESGGARSGSGLCKEDQNGDLVDGNEMPKKKIKTENWLRKKENSSRDDLIEGNQLRVKKERNLEGPPVKSKEELKAFDSVRSHCEAPGIDCFDFSDLIRDNQKRIKKEIKGIRLDSDRSKG